MLIFDLQVPGYWRSALAQFKLPIQNQNKYTCYLTSSSLLLIVGYQPPATAVLCSVLLSNFIIKQKIPQLNIEDT